MINRQIDTVYFGISYYRVKVREVKICISLHRLILLALLSYPIMNHLTIISFSFSFSFAFAFSFSLLFIIMNRVLHYKYSYLATSGSCISWKLHVWMITAVFKPQLSPRGNWDRLGIKDSEWCTCRGNVVTFQIPKVHGCHVPVWKKYTKYTREPKSVTGIECSPKPIIIKELAGTWMSNPREGATNCMLIGSKYWITPGTVDVQEWHPWLHCRIRGNYEDLGFPCWTPKG